MTQTTTLDHLNAATPAEFAAILGPVFENAAWVAEAAAALRPFATVTFLHDAMFRIVDTAPGPAVLAFLNGHPDLAGVAARQRSMGGHSTAEQAALGLDRLDEAGFARFAAMNEAYRTRFGFPFLICVRRHSRGSILRQFALRIGNTPEAERAAALQEVFRITRIRIASLVEGPGMPRIHGGLSTHVLDTAHGRPGQGVQVELFLIEETGPERVATAITDADGRAPGGLIPDTAPLRIGLYELRFHMAAYFRTTQAVLADPPFYDVIPVRIGLSDAEAHYHVPLLVTPWTYSTYRGS